MAPSLAHDSHGLQPGQGLNKNTFIASPGGCFQLWMQNDGNVVLYSFGRAIWSTGTDQSGGAYLVMQGDGNLVVYDGWGTPVWWSGTQGHAGAALFLQQDGNIVIYHGNAAVWASRTVTACVDPRCLNTCLDACAADFQDLLDLDAKGYALLQSKGEALLLAIRPPFQQGGLTSFHQTYLTALRKPGLVALLY
ncbi:MAG: hypothetical protein IPL60_10460 [Ardenticatenia bacterium]|nr:hypothetical protein [Ardenticatenia bacterium]